jgi:hypothetical protein
MRFEELGRLKEGMTLADVQSTLDTDQGPAAEQVGSRKLDVLRLPEQGVKVFFKGGKVDTVAYEAPFSGAVRGVRIGASKDQVERLLGQPDRLWPVQDGTDRWMYESGDFLRVDFDPQTQTVRGIFR